MAETYCGKTCAECALREKLNCQGCKMGPGKPYTGECTITRCCVNRGHSTCTDCTTASTCSMWKQRGDMPAERLRKREADATQKFVRDREYNFLAQWIGFLFWYVIITIGIRFVVGMVSGLMEGNLFGEIVDCLIQLGHALILLKLASSTYCFRTAGVCSIISLVFTFLGAVLAESGFGVLFAIVAVVPSLVSQYHEYIGYAEVTEEVDEELAGKWRVVWYISLGGLIVLAISLVLTMFGSLLGALLTVVSSVAVLVIEVFRIVFLYKTAQLFRNLT